MVDQADWLSMAARASQLETELQVQIADQQLAHLACLFGGYQNVQGNATRHFSIVAAVMPGRVEIESASNSQLQAGAANHDSRLELRPAKLHGVNSLA